MITMNQPRQHEIDLTRHLIKKGPKFRSHTIVFEANRAYLKPTLSALFFCAIYIVVGLFLLGLSVFVYLNNQQMDLVIFLCLSGASIMTFGFMLMKPLQAQGSFNKNLGKFINDTDRSLKLENILSLQITNKMITSKNGVSYPCYELNVLTRYGRRLNILNHNDLGQMQSDAQQLSEFLDVPLLDCQKEIIL